MYSCIVSSWRESWTENIVEMKEKKVWTLDEWKKEKMMHQEMLVSQVAFGLFAFQRAEKRA